MTQEQLEMILDSYGLDHMLNLNDIEPSHVVRLLIDEELLTWSDLYEQYID